MNNPDTNSSSALPANAPASKSEGSGVARILVIAAVTVGPLGIFAVGIPWGRYRLNNVVLSDAEVKGTVTKIGARIDGRIKSIEVEVGQPVTAGEVLLRMDDRHLLASLEGARA